MSLMVSLIVFGGIYLLLGVMLLTPFMLSARISRQEEDQHQK
jgi:hypothetical protein